ncbi:hypothetical protein LCGC14_1196160 [marine sediment metagenome]|uniref:Uncharacterized protein n=1 Tax=marine sediment metagenome TaxID=412755 RepID=A0A0F9LIE6_9ZZZZ
MNYSTLCAVDLPLQILHNNTMENKLKDIQNNPENHIHKNFDALMACAFVNGAINLAIMTAHEGLCGYNGGVPCDVRSGPCSCGAWH